MEQPKKPVGRPRVETYLDPEWSKIIIESGKEGKHITDFLIKLGISWETHYELLKRNKKYSETVATYQKFCENYWYQIGLDAMNRNGGVGFNSRMWSLVMRNKFKDNWRDEKSVDVTTQGEKIKEENPIQIEIIRKQVDNGEI
jgi:hypothetical protein